VLQRTSCASTIVWTANDGAAVYPRWAAEAYAGIWWRSHCDMAFPVGGAAAPLRANASCQSLLRARFPGQFFHTFGGLDISEQMFAVSGVQSFDTGHFFGSRPELRRAGDWRVSPIARHKTTLPGCYRYA